jgi:hypothetical protein
MEAFYVFDLSINDNLKWHGMKVSRQQKNRKSSYWQSMLKATIGILITPIFLMVTNKEAFSAKMSVYISRPESGLKSIVIEGEIMKGDYMRFVEEIGQHNGKIGKVYIFSPGGNFSEAIEIGRAIRRLELTTVVPERENGQPRCDPLANFPEHYSCDCAGSCFFIFIGGVNRAGTYMEVHSPSFDENEFGQLSEEDARNKFIALQKSAREYMREMGVPKHLREKILGTQPERAMKVDYETVKKYFHGEIPYRHELLQAKCAKLKDDKKIRDCYVAVDNERRLAAYEKFFGR